MYYRYVGLVKNDFGLLILWLLQNGATTNLRFLKGFVTTIGDVKRKN